MSTITGRWSRGTGSVALTGPNRCQEITPSMDFPQPCFPQPGTAWRSQTLTHPLAEAVARGAWR